MVHFAIYDVMIICLSLETWNVGVVCIARSITLFLFEEVGGADTLLYSLHGDGQIMAAKSNDEDEGRIRDESVHGVRFL